MEIKLSITKARADLAFDSPFFGSVAVRLKMVEKPDLNPPTLAVDGKNIFYHPQWIAENAKLVKSAIVHEVLHVIMLHHTRRGDRDPYKWNVACDYAINPIVAQNGFPIGDSWLYETKYDGLSAERIYEKLDDNNIKQMQQNGEGALDEIIEPTDEESRKEAEVEAKELQSTAQAAAKEAGKSPKGVDKFIEFLQKPQVRWQDQLREYLTNSVNGNVMWHIPNRRLLNTVYMPHYEKQPSGSIAIAFDVSGSVSEREIQQYGSEIQQIARDNNIERLDVLYVNSKVVKTQHFENGEDIHLKPRIGGGTEFEPAFLWLEGEGITPHALVYFTDGYGRFNFSPPQFPVIWCISSDKIAPWGTTVSLENLL